MSTPPRPTFEQVLPILNKELKKRKSSWTLASIDFEDVCQIITIHVFEKYDQYNEKKGEFSHWVNRIISNRIHNILRDNYYKHNRPCVGCLLNLGGDTCSFTTSGTQCSECPLFARWKQKKESHFNVKQTLTLETHSQEVNNTPCDFIDIGAKKQIIDEKMKLLLSSAEYSWYILLYINHSSPEEAGEKLGFKKGENSEIPGYQMYLKAKKKIIQLAQKIILEEGLSE